MLSPFLFAPLCWETDLLDSKPVLIHLGLHQGLSIDYKGLVKLEDQPVTALFRVIKWYDNRPVWANVGEVNESEIENRETGKPFLFSYQGTMWFDISLCIISGYLGERSLGLYCISTAQLHHKSPGGTAWWPSWARCSTCWGRWWRAGDNELRHSSHDALLRHFSICKW